ncbi:MAG TPA: signal peptide peptidase SppA [Gemmataceae bacterium]|nr:signal peptide peptidase SppA [Gemmataceae bacterium]
MMRRLPILACLLIGASGCLQPVRVITEDHLRFDNPVTAEFAPTNNAHPIVAMPVEGGATVGKSPHVAIIDVDGLLLNTNLAGPYSSGDNPVDIFREKLDVAAADPNAVAVVVRINSPGGSVTASDIMWRDLQRFREKTRRPVVACLMDLGTSGAYYLSTACDLIVAHPTTVTGGIGVVLNLYNLEDAMNVLNIVSQAVKAGEKIDLGTVTRALQPEEEALLKEMANEFYDRFRAVVRQQRQKVDATEKTTFDGRVFTSSQALKLGLIDQIGYLDEALKVARERAGHPLAGAVLLHRTGDVARTPYATTPNYPLHVNLLPASLPGLDRSKLPTFLYMWQPDPTLERFGGK